MGGFENSSHPTWGETMMKKGLGVPHQPWEFLQRRRSFALCTSATYPFPRLVGEELRTLAVVRPGPVVAWYQLPAPVQVTPPIGMA